MTTESEDGLLSLRITINGTAENPWHRYNLRANPFPQLGKAEYDRAERAIASLDGDPVTCEQDIRDRLKGFGPDFIDLCVAKYRPGERTRFFVTFPKKEEQ